MSMMLHLYQYTYIHTLHIHTRTHSAVALLLSPYPPPLDGHQRRRGDAVLLLMTKTLLTSIYACTHRQREKQSAYKSQWFILQAHHAGAVGCNVEPSYTHMSVTFGQVRTKPASQVLTCYINTLLHEWYMHMHVCVYTSPSTHSPVVA